MQRTCLNGQKKSNATNYKSHCRHIHNLGTDYVPSQDMSEYHGRPYIPFTDPSSAVPRVRLIQSSNGAGSFAPNPQLSLPDDQDKLSDYIPASNEISRVPSRQQSTADDEEEESANEQEEDNDEEEHEENDADDQDVKMEDVDEKEAGGKKQKASVLKKQSAARERTKQKKEAKRNVDDQVGSSLND